MNTETTGISKADFYQDNVFCPQCNSVLDRRAMRDLICTAFRCSCGEVLFIEDGAVELRGDCKKFENTESVTSEIWWHATISNNWHEEVLTALNGKGIPVHLGTWYGAIDRGISITTDNGVTDGGFTLYGVTINPHKAVVAGKLYSDKEAQEIYEKVLVSGYAEIVYPYKNVWESPGSVSLVAHPEAITVVEKYFYDADDLKNFESLYMNL